MNDLARQPGPHAARNGRRTSHIATTPVAAAEPGAGLPSRLSLERSGRLLVVLLAAIFVVSAGILGGMTYRTLQRMDKIQTRVDDAERVRSIALDLERLVLDALASDMPLNSARVVQLRMRLDAALESISLEPAMLERLRRIAAMIGGPGEVRPSHLLGAVELVRATVDLESAAEARMLAGLRRDTQREFSVAVGMLVVLTALVLLSYGVLRTQILTPLRALRELLNELAHGDFNTLVDERAHPIIRPLLENYNYLVTRLAELEEQHRSRAATLESEVRAATEAILEQHRSLARAEKLAAVGELTAGLAHELRNPLAGILMALGNIRTEVTEPGLRERVDMVSSEIERLVRLLNAHLSTVHGEPEAERRVDLHALVDDLLTLVRYQVPPTITLQSRVPEGLACMLPRDRVRQALLNLILNSVQALGGSPGRIEVDADLHTGRLELSVNDDGPGFPPTLLRGGVRPFATSREAGTGLGLAMVRRVAVDLGGELQLADRNGHGASARMLLPYRSE